MALVDTEHSFLLSIYCGHENIQLVPRSSKSQQFTPSNNIEATQDVKEALYLTK